ncbi:hypothetical protein B6D60_10485 [candidate division KSB1 bacterium 4484_87]|nr:MAG: hypothetical protein B6D60_10485 [candidate division KSB1 bacterium 4484_87]
MFLLFSFPSIVFSQNSQGTEGETICLIDLAGLKQIADIRLNDFYNPSLYFFVIQSTSSFPAYLRINITVTDCIDPKLQLREVILETDEFQITPQHTNYTFLPEQIINIKIDDDLRDAIVTNGGMLLAGRYCFQFQLLNKDNGQLAGISNTECLEVSVPDPPELIYPENNAIIQNGQINFQWLSVGVRQGLNIRYRLTIAEKETGQTAQEAILNIPFFLSDDSKPIEKNSNGTREIINFVYPFDLKMAEPLATGKTYVWQIQAFDEFGRPVGGNQGKSRIFSFNILSSDETSESIEIIFEFKPKDSGSEKF